MKQLLVVVLLSLSSCASASPQSDGVLIFGSAAIESTVTEYKCARGYRETWLGQSPSERIGLKLGASIAAYAGIRELHRQGHHGRAKAATVGWVVANVAVAIVNKNK